MSNAHEKLFGQAPKNECMVWAMIDCNLNFSTFNRGSFKNAMQSFKEGKAEIPSSRALKQGVADLASHLRLQIKQKLSGTTCVIAIDGGTLQRRTLLNFVAQPCSEFSKPIFVCSKEVPDGKAATIAAAVREVRSLVSEVFRMKPVAIVSDNAAAMARGIADQDEEDNNEEEANGIAQHFFETDSGENEDPGFDENFAFFVHIRCWAHSMQLCIGDLGKHCADAINALRRVVSMPRSRKAELRQARARGGHSLRALVFPCATRWNSATRACERVIELQNEIVEVGVPLDASEILALRIFIIVTAPFCWATTAMQADNATLASARFVCGKIRNDLDLVRGKAQELPPVIRQKVLLATGCALESLERREAAYLKNEVTEAIETIESTSPVRQEKWEHTHRLMTRYYNEVGITIEDFSSEVDNYTFRSDAEREKSKNEEYWKEIRARYPCIARFRNAMLQLLVSEAAVERTFQRQGEIWNSKRNRLAQELVQDQLFIALNYKNFRVREQEEEEIRAPRKEDVTHESWMRHIALLSDEGIRPPRPVRNKVNVKEIALGKRVEVKFHVNGREEKWYKGTIISVLNETRHEFEVAWDEYESLETRITVFKPVTVDHDWRFSH